MMIRSRRIFLLLYGVIFSVITIFSAQANPANSRQLTYEQAIRDARQLLQLLELSHPDPYSPMGGKVNFKRQAWALLKSIPKHSVDSASLAVRLQRF
jgi:hypothetical protein